MPSFACRTPGCFSPATHRVVLTLPPTAGPTGAHDATSLVLCQAHAGTVTFSLVTDVLAALGIEIVERRALSETESSPLAG